MKKPVELKSEENALAPKWVMYVGMVLIAGFVGYFVLLSKDLPRPKPDSKLMQAAQGSGNGSLVEHLVKTHGSDERLFFGHAEMLEQQNHFSEAADEYTRALALEPDDIEALTHRADCFRHLRQFEKAIEDFELAIKLDSKNSDAANWRATAETLKKSGKKPTVD